MNVSCILHTLTLHDTSNKRWCADVLVEIVANRRTIPRRKTTVNVKSQCDLLVLKLDDALQLCSMFPFMRLAMEAVAARRETAVAELSRGYARTSVALNKVKSLHTVRGLQLRLPASRRCMDCTCKTQLSCGICHCSM